MVKIAGGKRKRISDIKVGDSVLAVDEKGTLQFSQVIMHMHRDPEMATEFQVIRTKSGRNLTLSEGHMVYKTENPNEDLKQVISSKPVFAKKIRKGDFLIVNDEFNGMMKDERRLAK